MAGFTNTHGAFCEETAALNLETWESSGEAPWIKNELQ